MLNHYATADDEGWHSETNSWEHCGDHVRSEWRIDGRDCDGRLTREGASTFTFGNEAAGYRDEEPAVTYPLWECGDERQRDYTAESMGY